MQIDKETLLRTGIPRRYWGAETDLVMPESGGVYLWGLVGRGKTHAACALALRELANGTPMRDAQTGEVVAYRTPVTRFCTMVDAKDQLRDTFGTRQSAHDLRSVLFTCDLLILDDVGREDPKPWAQEFLWTIVDARYRSLKRTIVTSNYSRGELAGRIMAGSDATMANAIVSRLAEMTTPIHVEGPDRRIQQ